jgi:HD superfamily phosphohydrolase/tRNA A-37 threonylcarbamoyl transferase component Bud32
MVKKRDDLIFPFEYKIGPYVLTNPDDSSGEKPVRPIGSGGSAFVYQAMQSFVGGAQTKRALKLFNLRPDILKKRLSAGQTEGEHGFLDEISTIASINHQNIVKIIDAGKDDNGQPFFVMEYVDGPSLKTALNDDGWIKQAKSDPFLVLRIAQQICGALAYLHGRNRYHFDIAPKNIFVGSVKGSPHILVGDLGVSRTLEQAPDQIFIAGTKEFAPPEIQAHLATGYIARSELERYAAHWDLFALAKTVIQMMQSWEVDGHQDLRALTILCKRVLEFDTDLTANGLSVALERLLPDHVLTVGIEEISNDAAGAQQYIALPIRQVPLSRRMRKVFQHPTMTHLQQVPQLMLYRSSAPGGVHTVYEHLLGSYGLMLRTITKLVGQPQFRASFFGKELEEALLASALSRLGSFPLERLVMSIREITLDEKRKNILKILNRTNEDENKRSLFDLIRERFILADLDVVVGILISDPNFDKPYQKIIKSLLKSSIDVRVMDYLLRDSHHTGIPAGDGIDIDHIVDAMRWIPNSDVVGIHRSAVFSVEHLLCARYWMFARLYWNSPNRSITAMLRHIVFDILSEHDTNPFDTANDLRLMDESGALEYLNKKATGTVGYDQGDRSIISLLKQARPKSYNQILERFVLNWGEDTGEAKQAMNRIAENSDKQIHSLQLEFYNTCSYRNQFSRSQLVFDFPREDPLKLGDDIIVEIGTHEHRPLNTISSIARILPQTFNESAVRFRAFAHPILERELTMKIAAELAAFLDFRFMRAG